MSLPIRNLPVIQNYDCHACGNCCTDYWVPVSTEEKKRIEEQHWENDPALAGKKLFVRYGWPWKWRYRLAQSTGDRCIFLNEKGLCRIHAKFGLDAKPFACRLYPYILVPHGDHWRVSLRFACPSATGNKGRPLTDQLATITEYAREMEHWDARPGHQHPPGEGLGDPPPLQGRQRVGWDDLSIFTEALVKLLSHRGEPFSRRMLKCLALVRMCRRASFDKLSGPRLREFLTVMSQAVNAEVPRDLGPLNPPGWIGRILFRSSLALFLRKDQGTRRGVSKRGRIALMAAMWRFTRGTGLLPRLQIGLPERTFAEFEQPSGPLTPEAEELLVRYFLIKTESMQFCGQAFFRWPVWDGFESLALLLPMMQWLARGYRELPPRDAMLKAITVIDENFGYTPMLGKARYRLGIRILAYLQELDRLIAWYGQSV
jgi:lysine-N-methylase